MKTVIKNVNIVQPDHIINNGAVVAEDGIITAYGDAKTLPIPDDAEVIDGEGDYIGPGLVDIHTHASDKVFFQDDPFACAQHHLKHGTTSVYPALYFALNADQYVAALRQMKSASKDERGKNIAGVYMEGPFLNPNYGGNKESNPWHKVDPQEYKQVIEEAKDFAVVYCIAPERQGVKKYVEDVRKLNPNAVFSVAHSECDPAEVEALMPLGLKIGTHFSDATGKFHRWPDKEIVGVGPDEAVLMNDELYAELIVDNAGIHVDPYLIRLVKKIKGDDHIILISDAFCDDGPIPPEYPQDLDINFDHTGEIAGSRLTLDQACRNMMKHTGCGILEVFKYAALNPARAIGAKDRGEIAIGKRADFIIVDDKFNLKKVIFAGVEEK